MVLICLDALVELSVMKSNHILDNNLCYSHSIVPSMSFFLYLCIFEHQLTQSENYIYYAIVAVRFVLNAITLVNLHTSLIKIN